MENPIITTIALLLTDIAIALIFLGWAVRLLMKIDRKLEFQNRWLIERHAERTMQLGESQTALAEALRDLPTSPFRQFQH